MKTSSTSPLLNSQPRRQSLLRNLAIICAAAGFAGLASAAPKNWAGPSPGTTTSPVSGTWDNSSLNWNATSGAGTVAFTAGTIDGAIFGGVDGTYAIQVANGLGCTNFTFLNSGYTISAASPVVITNSGVTAVTVASGKTATIGANITLRVTGNASVFNNGITSGGTLIIDNGAVYTQPGTVGLTIDGAPGSTVRVLTGGVLSHTGGGSQVRIGSTAGSDATVSVEGGNFFESGTPQFNLGISGTGTVTVVSGMVSNINSGSLNFGVNSGSVGKFNLNGGLTVIRNMTKGNVGATAIFNFNGGTLKAGSSASAGAFMNGLDTANVRNGGAVVDNNGFDITIGQTLLHSTVVGDNATDGGLTTANSSATLGSLSLTNANTYNGPTTVSTGTKLVTTTRSVGGGAYSVADNAILEVQVGAAGQSLNMSSLTLGGGGNVTNNFNLGANGSTTVPVVQENGALALNGPTYVSVSASGLAAGTYPLMSYSSITGSGNFIAGSLPVVSGFIAALTNDTTSKQLKLVYSAAPQPVKWAVGDGNWDTTSPNWNLLSGVGPTTYVESASAAFDDTATGTSPITVTLTGDHSPNSISNNAVKTYVLAGNFNLLNSTVTKDGAGTLILDNGNGNTFSAITIDSGTLQVGNNDTGGSLGSGIVTNNGTLAINRTDDFAVSSLIAGTGTVIKNGSDTVTVTATNTYSGLTVINSGQLSLGASLVNSTVSNNVAGGLGFASGNTAAAIGGLAGSGDISLLNAASTLVGLTVGSNNASTVYSGAFTGAGNLFKAGTGNLTLSGDSTFNSVQVTTPGSILTITNGNITMNNALQIVTDNGTLIVSGGTTTVAVDSRIAGSNGVINVTGGVLNLPKLVIGSTATSTNSVMTVSGNAVISQNQPGGSPVQGLWIGGNNGGSGSLVLKGNASWNNPQTAANTVVIGNNGVGQGAFTIQDSATFNNGTVIRVADLVGNGGTVNLNGGVMSVNGFSKGAGLAVINANGGTLQALVPTTSFFANFTNSILLLTNGLTFDNNGNDVTITNVLSGTGGLTKIGPGTLTLTGSNTYTGATAVNGGSLAVSSAAAIGVSSSIAVTNASLVLSNVLVNTGGLNLSDATVQLAIINFPTNIVAGTLSTAGGANVINITSIAGSGAAGQATPLIKYTSLAPGVVDVGNNLTTLGVNLPTGFVGYLTNNTVRKTIDLVLTDGLFGPLITAQPNSITRYKGTTGQFSVTAFGATGYFWRTNGVALTDGGNVSGTASNVLTIVNVGLSDSNSFDVVVTNTTGSITSSIVTVTVLDATNYAATNLLFGPVSYYRFNEPDNSQPAFDFVGGKDGTYLANVSHVAGPQPQDGYVNFEPDNLAFQCAAPFVDAHVNISNSWSINTNTVTLVGWVFPIGTQASFTGIIQNRGGGVVCGLNYSPGTNGDGNHTLGYTWNNDPGTYGWDSGLVPPLNQWSLVALVVTPTNATVFVGNTNGVASSVHVFDHPVQAFNGPISIGSDLSDAGNRSFTGNIDEVSAFDHALTKSNITDLITAASGITSFPPQVTTQPISVTAFEHQTVQFSVQVAGSDPLVYQWMRGSGGSYTNVPAGLTPDTSVFSGTNTTTLVISNVALADAADYVIVVTNTLGNATSSVATLTVNPTLPPETITMSIVEASGQDWNTAASWSDGLPASTSAVEKPGSTYRILTAGGMRTPNTASDNTFPGDTLFVDGNGTFDSAITTVGALILKDQSPGAVNFTKLVMDGGEILSFTDNNNPTIIGGGEMNVIANAPIAGLSSTGGRSITIRSQLTGNGSIQYVGYANTTFQPTVVTALNITNVNNTYTGTWFVENGTLVGSSPGALGTNSITINTNGVLQTTYDINNPNGDLVLWGRVNLTGNDTFNRVFVNGVQLAGGVYSAATLASTYPNNFPLSWTGATGAEGVTTASGSITVGSGVVPTPGTIGITNSGGVLQVTWTNSNTLLLSATNLLGPWVTNTGATSPYTVTNDAPQEFFQLRTP